MTYIERVFIALLLLTWCGCATSKTSEQHLDAVTAVDSAALAQATETRTVQTGPETITTTVEEFVQEAPPRAGPVSAPTAARAPASGPPAIIRRTVTVDQRGPSLQQTTLNAQASTETHATAALASEAHSSKKTSWWPPWWLWLGAAAAIAGAAYAVWRIRPPWIKWLLPS